MYLHQSSPQRIDKSVGYFIGAACGDVVGTNVEFLARGSFKPVRDMISGGKFQLQAGMWTDDKAMTLCLAESLIIQQGFDAEDQMLRYWQWLNYGHNSCLKHAFGVGKTILNALFRYHQTGQVYSGRTESRYSGNGSLMRLAPIILYYQHDLKQLYKYAALSSKTTHSSTECIGSCQYFSQLVVNALQNKSKEELLEMKFPTQLEYLNSIVREDYKTKQEHLIHGSGFVLNSLEAALWAFWHSNSFEDAILKAVNLGDDADTTASICGQLAGAFYGFSAIPHHWKDRLYRYNDLKQIALLLIRQAHLYVND